jgi:flavin-binding protein dodecin
MATTATITIAGDVGTSMLKTRRDTEDTVAGVEDAVDAVARAEDTVDAVERNVQDLVEKHVEDIEYTRE